MGIFFDSVLNGFHQSILFIFVKFYCVTHNFLIITRHIIYFLRFLEGAFFSLSKFSIRLPINPYRVCMKFRIYIGVLCLGYWGKIFFSEFFITLAFWVRCRLGTFVFLKRKGAKHYNIKTQKHCQIVIYCNMRTKKVPNPSHSKGSQYYLFITNS